MLSPNPLSLLCALLICLPLAFVFTFNSPNTTTTISAATAADIFTSYTTQFTRFDIRVTTIVCNQTKTLNPQISSLSASLSKPSSKSTKSSESVKSPPLPPIRVEYEDDKILLRRASRKYLQQPKRNPNSPKKLAFMFLTTNNLPFAPLWELYFKSTPSNLYNIYIHTDPSLSAVAAKSVFNGVFRDRVIPSKPTRRLTPTLTSAARRLLAQALLHDPLNSHFALISASCIPLHSFNFTYKTVIRSRKSFVEILNNEDDAYERWAARGDQKMLPTVPFESFRIGSQFWVMTSKHARSVVSDVQLWEKFKLPCLNSDACYPEENYFPTLINNVDYSGCVPATLTHVDWTDRIDGHPRTYGAREVNTELILRLRSDRPRYGDESSINGSDFTLPKRHHPFLFARKFSRKSLQPLMSIANDVIFKDD